jgi:glycosyltransferase involved in cell wall biosynthesis
MKVSVVTVSYNQAKYLRSCIDSVLLQDYADIEYIIVDPGSVDGSREIIESYGSKIIKIFERDDGAADGLNKGFSVSTGDILYFLNSDDLVLPGALSFAVDFFKKNPLTDVLHGAGYIIDGDGNIQKYIRATRFGVDLYLYGCVNLLQQSFFFRRSAFERTSGFNRKNRVCWDGELFLDMKLAGAKFKAVSKPLGVFRIYPGTITSAAEHANKLRLAHKELYFRVKGRDWSWWDDLMVMFYWIGKQFSAIWVKFNQ